MQNVSLNIDLVSFLVHLLVNLHLELHFILGVKTHQINDFFCLQHISLCLGIYNDLCCHGQ
jgi:hypothetical protein